MAGGSDIRAGKAFVELGLKDQLTKGLKGIQKQLDAFGAGVTAVGKRFALLGGAITAPMLAATASWAASGAELYRLTQRTGMSAEGLSALAFAAEETGGSAEGMTAAVRRMNIAIAGAERGNAAMTADLAAIGVSLDQLKGKSPDEQFALLAERISQVRDPVQQSAFAMKFFGRGAMDLMPLLRQGAAGMEQYRKQAEELGLVKTTEATHAAFELEMAWKRMTGSLNVIKGAVASSLAPMLQGIAQWTTTVARQVQIWVKANRPLVVTIFQIGAALLGAGTGLVIAGKGFSILGGIVGKLMTPLGLFGKFLGLAGGLLGFLLSPVGLLIAGLAGLAAYFLYASGVGQKALAWLGGVFSDLVKDAKESFGAIAEALEAGDISAAVRVLWAQIKLWWTEGTDTLLGLWDDFHLTFIQATAGIRVVWREICAGIETEWRKTIDGIKDNLRDLAAIASSSGMGALGRMIGTALRGGSLADIRGAAITGGVQAGASGAAQVIAGRGARAPRDYSDIAAAANADIADIGGGVNRAAAARANRRQVAADAVAAAQKDLDAARAAAHTAAAQSRSRKMEEQKKPELGGDLDAMLAGRSQVSGTFSGAAAALMGGAGGFDKLARKMDRFISTGDASTTQLKRIGDALTIGK